MSILLALYMYALSLKALNCCSIAWKLSSTRLTHRETIRTENVALVDKSVRTEVLLEGDWEDVMVFTGI